MEKNSVRIFLVFILTPLLWSCSPKGTSSRIQIQMPSASSKNFFNSLSALVDGSPSETESDSPWAGSIFEATEINCYVIMIGGQQNGSSCNAKDSTDVAVSFQRYIGGIPSSGIIEMELASGIEKRIVLLGLTAADGRCTDFRTDEPTDDGSLSHPRILYDQQHIFEPGEQSLQIALPNSLEEQVEIGKCHLEGDEPDSAPEPPPIAEALEAYGGSDNINNFNGKFGRSIASSENLLVIGSPNGIHPTGVSTRSGFVKVYELTDGSWTGPVVLQIPTIRANDRVGFSVDTDGQSIIVGAPAFSPSRPGEVYLYSREGAGWGSPTIIQGTQNDDEFGLSVAVQGNVAVMGAPAHTNAPWPSGRAQYLVRAPNTASWDTYTTYNLPYMTSQPQVFDVSGNDAQFGFSVAISKNAQTIAVGAPNFEQSVTNTDNGAIFAYKVKLNGTLLSNTPRATITPNGLDTDGNGVPDTNLSLGNELAISSDMIVSGFANFSTPVKLEGFTTSISFKVSYSLVPCLMVK